MKKLFLAISIVVACLFCSELGFGRSVLHSGEPAKQQSLEDVQQSISEKILRFHVVANSDTDEDQALKLKVKESVVDYITPMLERSTCVEESRMIIEGKQQEIQQLAEKIIAQEGYTYPVTVGWEQTYFPTKAYGAFTFPPGTYEAFMIRIGTSKGKNWWCVLYPPLCFVDVSHGIVNKSGSEQLQQVLTTQEYEAITGKEVKVRFRYLRFLNRFFEK